MAELEITIPGAPVAWQRPRKGKTSKSGKFHFFEADKVKSWRNQVRTIASEAMADLPMLGGDPKHKKPLNTVIELFLPRPQQYYRQKDPEGPVYAPARPDYDNMAKGIIDALQGVVFADDGLICSAHVYKRYHAKEGHPGTKVWVDELKGPEVAL